VSHRSRAGILALSALLAVSIVGAPERSAAQDPGYLGVLFSQETVNVSAEVSGSIRNLRVELGAEVEKGEVLVSLESQDLRSEEEQTRAALQTARALADQAKAELDDVTRLLERRRGAAEIFPAEEVEALETQREVARAEWDAAKSTVLEREATLREVERRIESLDVRAPFAGAVAACPYDVGTRVNAGQTLVRLIGTGNLWVRFAVPSRESDWLEAGRMVRVEPERLRDSWQAEVRRIAPEIDPATDMIFVEAVLIVAEGRKTSFRSRPWAPARRAGLRTETRRRLR
jgi:RND family efflux transporter MFP subunit